MADQKISQLTAVVTPVNTNELAVNESGTSKKITINQIQGGITQGAIPFVDSTGVFSQDSFNLFYDSVNILLGIGTDAPEGSVHISSGPTSIVNPTSQADGLIIQNSEDVGITLFSPAANVSSIVFGSPSGTGNEGARIRWSNDNDLFSIATTETNADIILAPGFLAEAMRLKSTGEVLMGTSTLDSSAILNLTSTTQGFLPPRMTTTQRDAISSPAAGLMIYNTTTNLLNFFNGTVWGAI